MDSDIFLTSYRHPYDEQLKGDLFVRAETHEEAEKIASALEFRAGQGVDEQVEGIQVDGRLIETRTEDGELIADYEEGEIGPAFFD